MAANEPTSVPVDWRGLTAAEPAALASASDEVEIYVRVLAAYGVIVDRDAVPSELQDRQKTLRAKLWPDDPLDGFQLHSSLGAYLVTKVAVDLVPTGHLGLRPEYLDPGGLVRAMCEHGASEVTVRSVVGDWPGVPPEFSGDPEGLGLSVLAGLAERTLTRQERILGLAQVAASPRDLARLSAAIKLLSAVRAVLPLVPVQSLGVAYDLAVVGLSVGRADRVAALLSQPVDVLEAVMQELGAATASLEAGQAYKASLDDQVAMPASAAPEWHEDTVVAVIKQGPLAAVCRWREATVDGEELATWKTALSRWSATRGTLGLRLPAASPTLVDRPIPPEAGLIRRSLSQLEDQTDRVTIEIPLYKWRDDALDAMAPVVRAALRIVAAACEGTPPPDGALERGGDMSWLVRRAAALAAVVRGELEFANEVTAPMPVGSAPERRWAVERARRYGRRQGPAVELSEARIRGAALLQDLAQQFARTITGTVPEKRH